MRQSILINKLGVNVNPAYPLIDVNTITGEAGSTLYFCQITIECFNGIITESNGLIVPDESTVVTTGLSGTLTFTIQPSQYAPYNVTITPAGIIDISTNCMMQWSGVAYQINVVANSIAGCNYIRILLDRN